MAVAAALTALLLLAGSGASTAGAAPPDMPTAQDILSRTNQLRTTLGRAPLQLCGNLIRAAQAHADDQAWQDVMSHTGSDGSSPVQRAERAGYSGWTMVGENVAKGYSTTLAVMTGWINSPGHYANLVNASYTHLGVGLAYAGDGTPYWSQSFGASGACGALPDQPVHPVGSLEVASSPGATKLRVAGWAADPDAGTAPIDVHVFVSGVGYNLGPAKLSRPDVGAAHPYGPNHGFDTTITVAPGNHEVCAIGINVGGGSNAVLGCRQVGVAAPPVQPIGSLEVVSSPDKGQVRVVGWAADPDAGTAPVDVHVFVSSVGTNLGPATNSRPDVGAAHPYGPNHGFDSTIGATPGQHVVCAVAINVGPGSNQGLGCKAVWVPDPASTFTDVLSSSPFFADITWLAETGITQGFDDGSFKPGSPVQRMAMAAFLHRATGGDPGPFPNPGFTDVGPGHPFLADIAWMVDGGYATGFGDGSFRPGSSVSRQATAAFLWRLAGEPAPAPGAPTFSDVPANHPFHQAIRWAAGAGITNGYPDGTFRGGAGVTRQAMAAFLHRWMT